VGVIFRRETAGALQKKKKKKKKSLGRRMKKSDREGIKALRALSSIKPFQDSASPHHRRIKNRTE
jgi:hypothetical protein